MTDTMIVGAFEHPGRRIPDATTAEIHAVVARGALADAGLSFDDVDGYFCAGDAPGMGGATMAEYLGLTRLRHFDSTETGGSSYLIHVRHAAMAIAAGACDVALITMGDRPLAEKGGARLSGLDFNSLPDLPYQFGFPPFPLAGYAAVARRHMHEYGTTAEQLAWVKVAASHHAQYNPRAMLPHVVTVDDVLASPLVADPLHRLDCCVVNDGGGALVLAREEIARTLTRPLVRVRGSGVAMKHRNGGTIDLTATAGLPSGRAAFAAAAVTPADIRYASIYDSFTITVITQLEDLGFCEKGQGGRFVADGGLVAGTGRLPVNTDGGGLCNSHPGNRGGMPKLIEAVRQARGEAHPAIQVADPALVLAHGIGGSLASYHVAATVVLEAMG